MSFCIHQALSLVMLNFGPACYRYLSNTDSIVCRLFSLCSLLLNLCTSMKNHSRVLLSSSLGISSSLRGSSGHLLHTSNQSTHMSFCSSFCIEFLQIASDHSKSGAQLISVQCFVLISTTNVSALSISSHKLPVNSLLVGSLPRIEENCD